MLTRAFWLGLTDRAVKTFAIELGSLMAAGHVLNLFTVPWVTDLGIAGGATVASVLLSLASAPIGTPGTTSALPGGA